MGFGDIKMVQAKQKIIGLKNYLESRILGQEDLVKKLIITLLADGHILVEGAPGLAKTKAIKTLAKCVDASFNRIQFTPDLLPSDITGSDIFVAQKGDFEFRAGPIFANLVLADEINRAPAKVQSALLEAMAEHQISVGGKQYKLPPLFMVMATQNPIEHEGTYNLPEAELDRFLLKVMVQYPTAQEEVQIVKSGGKAGEISVNRVLDAKKLAECRAMLEQVTADDKIVEYIVSLVAVTRPVVEKKAGGRLAVSSVKKDDIARYITYGASPRSGIALLQCAKAYALFAGRSFVLPEDVKNAAPSVLRHRLVLSYEAAADGITADDVITKILNIVPLP
jgi:MoxR-like ATPase